MSELRKRIETARDGYRAARYPGDLAADVMAPRLPLARIIAQGAVVAAAVAAVVLLALRLSQVTVEPQPEPQALSRAPLPAPVGQSSIRAPVFAALVMPQVPQGYASPESQSLALSAPSFPAMSLTLSFEPDSKETI